MRQMITGVVKLTLGRERNQVFFIWTKYCEGQSGISFHKQSTVAVMTR
jgi:hypothetical protein